MRFAGGLYPYTASRVSHEDSDPMRFVGGLYPYAASRVSHEDSDPMRFAGGLYPYGYTLKIENIFQPSFCYLSHPFTLFFLP